MDSVDLEVLRSATRWRKEGHAVILATVVKTWGSAPRPLGAMLAIREDGQVSGSVSGGCVEGDLIERVHAHKLASDKPEVATYGVSKEQADRFQLPCGGTLQHRDTGAETCFELRLPAVPELPPGTEVTP